MISRRSETRSRAAAFPRAMPFQHFALVLFNSTDIMSAIFRSHRGYRPAVFAGARIVGLSLTRGFASSAGSRDYRVSANGASLLFSTPVFTRRAVSTATASVVPLSREGVGYYG